MGRRRPRRRRSVDGRCEELATLDDRRRRCGDDVPLRWAGRHGADRTGIARGHASCATRPSGRGRADERPRPRRRPPRRPDPRRSRPSLDAEDVRIAGDEPWHLVVVERGGDRGLVAGAARAATRPRTCSASSPPRRGPSAWHNPGLDPDRVDTVLGTCCVVLAVMRKLRLDQIAVAGPASRAAADVRHPSTHPSCPSPLRLYGRRVVLRPLTPPDFAEWSEVRRRNEQWLTPWEPRGRRRSSTRRSTGTPSSPAARRAIATPPPGWPSASGCSSTSASPARSTSTTCCAARCSRRTIGYWIDQARAGHRLIAESVVVLAGFAFEQLEPAPPRDLHRPPQRATAAG